MCAFVQIARLQTVNLCKSARENVGSSRLARTGINDRKTNRRAEPGTVTSTTEPGDREEQVERLLQAYVRRGPCKLLIVAARRSFPPLCL